MRKYLRLYFLSVSFCLVCTSVLWGQQYSFKKQIGTTVTIHPNGIAIDKNGYIYVTSRWGSVSKLNADGRLLSFFGRKGNGDGELSAPKGIATDQNGYVYIADVGNHRIQKFDKNGNFLMKFGSLGSLAGQFNSPQAVFVDKHDNIWVADTKNNRIQKFDKNGNFLMKIGQSGSENGEFNNPVDINLDANGNICVVDSGNFCLQKFDPEGKFLKRFGSDVSAGGASAVARKIVTDSEGNIWVTDRSKFYVRKFDGDGNLIQEVELKGSKLSTPIPALEIAIDSKGRFWTMDSYSSIYVNNANGDLLFTRGLNTLGDNSDGIFGFEPRGVTTDIYNNIWVTDQENSRIQKFDKNGNFLMKFGSRGSGDGQFQGPIRMAIDRKNNIWVVDYNNYRIQKFDANGRFLLKTGSKGSGNGQFNQPYGFDFDENGNVWVTDIENNCIQKFSADGKFLQKVRSYFSAENSSSETQFLYPRDIEIDWEGNIWVADQTYRITKFDKNGNFLMKFGSSGSGDGQFGYGPIEGITTDMQNNLWVADSFNGRLQKFDRNGRFLTKINLPAGIVVRDVAVDKFGNVFSTSYFDVLIFSTDELVSFIKGRVYVDENQNCTFDGIDKPHSDIVITTQPGQYYGITDQNGNYEIVVDTGTYTVSPVWDTQKGIRIQPTCPVTNISPAITLNKGDMVTNIDFASKVIKTPYLISSVSSDRRRRCFASNTVINYSNSGYADAVNAKIYIKLPQHVVFKAADKPYTIDKDSNYVFNIDTIKANQPGTIHIIDSVACVANIRGLTQCTKVWITPSNNYTLPDDSRWDKSDIVLTGKCIENGRVQIVIKNIGQAMADSAEFRILLNAQLAFRKNYKLIVGDSLVLKIPANGKTVRLEADQRPDHPRKSQTNLTIEGCVASSSDVVSEGYVDVLPQDDAEPEVAIQCMQIIDSFDPNDKQVSPAGTPGYHYTPTNTELKYTIRFQNTGTDYAYNVTIIDTLSEYLDIATLQIGAVSHAYKLDITGKGRPILTWIFPTINLPDSTRDQAGSNGFIQFTIKPKTNLAEKTHIENYADIFFDYNDPVRTNTTANVLYDVPPVIAEENKLAEKGLLFLIPTISNFTPEQAQVGEQLTITGTNYQTVLSDNSVKINGVRASVVSATETQLIVTVPAGVTAGRVSVTTPGGTATSEAEFVMKPTANEQPQWSRPIVISPNPTDGRFTIDFSKTAVQIQTIEIYNHLGQRISSQTISKGSTGKEVDLSYNGAGIYLIVFKTDKGNSTRKLIIK
ncbi:DUF7619 domain-containing protein [Xanthocytophaga agilis]|uniref:6-bladed beta-propeller n=1 Tax=Xanthocytophaga agilis TaxID=3048010 RepID=A0AAE3UBV8_9BACT|nr:6-bladed beta-propeller [Xanthocytophaga agilis]MDJ1499470.1 6-bladed beta-propeller [Xanthocytophaga agilis]